MEIHNIINELINKDNLKVIRDYISTLRFELRFNALRELVYHVDIYLAEENLEQADRLLNAAEKLSRFLGDKYEDRIPG